MRYAIVNENGDVVNVAVWDGSTTWMPPKNHYAVYAPISDRGDTYDLENDVLHRKDRRSTGTDGDPNQEG